MSLLKPTRKVFPRADERRGCLLQQTLVRPGRDHAIAVAEVLAARLGRRRHVTGALSVLCRRLHDALHRIAVSGVRELARDTEEVGKIEVAEPEDIDAVDRSDRFDVFEAGARLDHADDHGTLVDRLHLVDHVARLVVVVRESERCAAPPLGRIAREGHDALGLFGRINERHHDAERAGIERARGEVVFGRHAHERRDAECAASANCGLSVS